MSKNLVEAGLPKISEALASLSGRSETAVALTERCLSAIEAKDGVVNAYLSRDRDGALAQARRVDAGEVTGPLAGIPIGIKDVLAVEGQPATAGSKILEGYHPPYTATAVRRLQEAGAVLLGKINCDEFAMGSSNENSAYGPVRNPHDTDRVPGGSSGGSAAAVAAGMALATLGTDTGGSIRQPASFCGVVGLLPTYGRVSRYGLIAFASSLDRIGPFTSSTRDAALVLGAIAGHDPMDATSSTAPVPDYTASIDRGVAGLRLGVPAEYFAEGLDPEVRRPVEETIEKLRAAGAEIVPVSLPHTRYAVPTYYVIATAEASSNLARFDGVRYGYRAADAKTLSDMYRLSREGGFGPEVKRRILLGTYVLSAGYYDAYYKKAQQVRRLLTDDFLTAFGQVDAILTPTAPTAAFKLGEKTDDPMAMYLADIYTVTASLAGICGLSVPCGTTSDGLPVGLQILGKHFDESTLFRVGQAVENLPR
ncbi:Asp-tRNA(Asn)/Glu-tRNA(Gln) amidotransferase subunit GatA [Silvibacterium dinghuense]|uniref:Glutamyl-tRNA(Gln) amidotransferase subunit A n=1 Tax=Silvibacterium dinghuense TaxID=1560006 RepID=A0A4Q1SJZ2_9BACT|nr:Asp-tRNA(Asn)/Glu-tRNA(Gln) amidotransferase subunit GatA [Silvibacterium dinghuense]RXS97986.1 Asp-tRNA(Asn)/Glu-tRNA(Gln) amidotransferase subunit GatA [Silvibacterium dinghuense]GGH03570.1 glutamyl-tRNA(Gln) amidotransferase subunit A [Silvibacterium dinghuense]